MRGGPKKTFGLQIGKSLAKVSIDSLKNISLKIGSGATPKGGKDAYKKDGISLSPA